MRSARERPQEQQVEILHLLPLGGVGLPHLIIGDELGVGLQELVDDLEAVGPNGAAGLRHLDDGVGQARDDSWPR